MADGCLSERIDGTGAESAEEAVKAEGIADLREAGMTGAPGPQQRKARQFELDKRIRLLSSIQHRGSAAVAEEQLPERPLRGSMSDARDTERSARVEVDEVRTSYEAGGVHPFITISRQPGAGGRSLAQAMLEVFARQDDVALFGGWHVFDRRLCEIVAEDPTLAGSLEMLLEEEYRSGAEDFVYQLLTPTTSQNFVVERVFRTVRTLAKLGKAIIVGRGGSQVTEGIGPRFSLRLIAPEDVRVSRIMEVSDLSEREVVGDVRKRDEHRARLVRRHFKADINDPLAYDVTWNTVNVTPQTIAEAVATAIRHRVATGQR